MMNDICRWITELVPLLASLAAFIYGAVRFLKKGKALYIQIVTGAMGCYVLANLYQVCYLAAFGKTAEGFTAACLGYIGFFLFLFTANYGQMDGLLDDGTGKMRKSRRTAIAGPLLAAVIFLVSMAAEMPLSARLSYGAVFIPAMLSMYYNLKHALIPDLGFGFAKAVRAYNGSAFIFSALTLLIFCIRAYEKWTYSSLLLAVFSILAGLFSVITLKSLEKGVKKWII